MLLLLDIVEFFGFYKIENIQFVVYYSVQWIGWSVFDKIEFCNFVMFCFFVGVLIKGSYDKMYEW